MANQKEPQTLPLLKHGFSGVPMGRGGVSWGARDPPFVSLC